MRSSGSGRFRGSGRRQAYPEPTNLIDKRLTLRSTLERDLEEASTTGQANNEELESKRKRLEAAYGIPTSGSTTIAAGGLEWIRSALARSSVPFATGLPPIDGLLASSGAARGGLRTGHVTEFVGGTASGKTTLIHHIMANELQREVLAALRSDGFLPPDSSSSASSGTSRRRLIRLATSEPAKFDMHRVVDICFTQLPPDVDSNSAASGCVDATVKQFMQNNVTFVEVNRVADLVALVDEMGSPLNGDGEQQEQCDELLVIHNLYGLWQLSSTTSTGSEVSLWWTAQLGSLQVGLRKWLGPTALRTGPSVGDRTVLVTHNFASDSTSSGPAIGGGGYRVLPCFLGSTSRVGRTTDDSAKSSTSRLAAPDSTPVVAVRPYGSAWSGFSDIVVALAMRWPSSRGAQSSAITAQCIRGHPGNAAAVLPTFYAS